MINPILLIALPLLLAFMTMVIRNKNKVLLIIGGTVNAVLAIMADKGEIVIGGFKAPFGINLIVDDFSYTGIVLVNVLFLAGLILSMDLGKKYAPILLSAIAGINGIIMTGDLFNLFVFLEITAISAYILSSSAKKYRHSFNYLILGSIGAVFYLLGITLLYNMTGTLNMADIAVKAAELSGKELFIPIILIFTGIAVEAKIMPVSGWVKGIYGNADRLTGSLFSSIFAAGILFVFGRLFADILSAEGTLNVIMIVLCSITFILGEFSAFRQTRVKKILMFSSIGQSGLAAMLLLSGLVFPAVLLIINNAISKMIMFSSTGAMEEKYGTDDYSKLKGVFMKNKLTGIAFTVSALTLTGLPFFLGFYGKINALYVLFDMKNYILPAVILIVTIVEGAYLIRLLVSLWTPGEEGQEAKAEYAVAEKKLMNPMKALTAFILALIILAAGLLPDRFGDIISKEHQLLDETNKVFDMNSLKGGE